jgi:hypothetical protein
VIRRFGRLLRVSGVRNICSGREGIARVELAIRAGHYVWRVVRCPFCPENHQHGGGVVGRDDPRRFLNHRVAHCVGVGGGYRLEDANPERTARLVSGVR